MKTSDGYRVVLVTCGTLKESRKIAKAVVDRRLAACASILPSPVESIYRWKGKVETAREYLMILKTVAKNLKALEREVLRLHSYDVPEFIALPIKAGSSEYFAWLTGNVAS